MKDNQPIPMCPLAIYTIYGRAWEQYDLFIIAMMKRHLEWLAVIMQVMFGL